MTSKSCLEIYTNKLCSYCGKSGHKFSECRLKKKHQEEKGEKAKLAKSESENPGCDDELAFVCHEVTKNESNETMHQSKSNGRGESETALVCIDGRHYPAFKGDTMIADSGCSCHLVRN